MKKILKAVGIFLLFILFLVVIKNVKHFDLDSVTGVFLTDKERETRDICKEIKRTTPIIKIGLKNSNSMEDKTIWTQRFKTNEDNYIKYECNQ